MARSEGVYHAPYEQAGSRDRSNTHLYAYRKCIYDPSMPGEFNGPQCQHQAAGSSRSGSRQPCRRPTTALCEQLLSQ
jgi:hypothetical protein